MFGFKILASFVLVTWTAFAYEVDVEKRQQRVSDVCNSARNELYRGCRLTNYRYLRTLERGRSSEQRLLLIRKIPLDTLCQEAKELFECFQTKLRSIPSECDYRNPSGSSGLQLEIKAAQDAIALTEHVCRYYIPSIRDHMDCITNVQRVKDVNECGKNIRSQQGRYDCTVERRVANCVLGKIDKASECKPGASQLAATIGGRIFDITESFCKFHSRDGGFQTWF